LCQLAFPLPGRLISLPPSGTVEPGDIEVRDECNELRWSFLARRRVSSGQDARFSVTGPDPISASMDGIIHLSFVFLET
jgi:hypothetical protein